jgi:hypothetical protein
VKWFVAAVVTLAAMGSAQAQETPPVPPVEDPVPVADFTAGDPVWEEYDSAFLSLAGGNARRAIEKLRAVAEQWPDHPAGIAARRRIALWSETVDRSPPTPTPAPVATDAPSAAARGEFVLWTTVSGALLAADLCVDRCNEDREWAAALMLSSGAALGLSLFATRHGIHQGEAQLYNAATTWGSWNALGLNDGFADTRREAGVSIALQLGGLAAGIGMWQAWRPTAGDVALTDTTFFWTTVLTLYAHLATDSEPTWQRVVLLGDVGILAGSALSTQVKMSRGRTLLIDTGGVLGSLVGGLFAAGLDDGQGAGIALSITTLAGLAIAAAATAHWDER